VPILHSQFTGQLQAADGTSVPAPPSLLLIQRGPVLQGPGGISQSIGQPPVQRGLGPARGPRCSVAGWAVKFSSVVSWMARSREWERLRSIVAP